MEITSAEKHHETTKHDEHDERNSSFFLMFKTWHLTGF